MIGVRQVGFQHGMILIAGNLLYNAHNRRHFFPFLRSLYVPYLRESVVQVDPSEIGVERILFATSEMEARGTNEYVVQLAKELKSRGGQVGVFCAPGPMLKVLAEEEIDTEVFPRLGRFEVWPAERKRFAAELKEFEPDIVHAQTIGVVKWLKRLRDEVSAPFALTMHAPPNKDRALQSVLDVLGGIIATSQNVRAELVNRCDVEKEKIDVIPNGIDISALKAREIRPIFAEATAVVGSVGPVERARGHELFVRAAAQISPTAGDLQFVVAGGGEQLPSLRKLSRELGLDECMTFVSDFSSYDEVMNALDIVVQTALVDVSGFSMLVPMGYGRPVIAFNTGTACEIIEDGKTGVLVPKDEVDGLVEAIVELAGDPEKARTVGNAARDSVETKFNIKSVADATLKFYGSLLG
jgi:glycosyltransferase involved in cell wall biosynthesis